MIQAINDALNAVGTIPMYALPSGAKFWLQQFGITALVGGIVSGISTALTIRISLFFASPLLKILGL